MCTCEHEQVHTCTYLQAEGTCTCIHRYVCFTCRSMSPYVSVNLPEIHVRRFAYLSARMHAYMHACVYTCRERLREREKETKKEGDKERERERDRQTYTDPHTHMCIYICVYTYTYIYIYICIHIHMCGRTLSLTAIQSQQAPLCTRKPDLRQIA